MDIRYTGKSTELVKQMTGYTVNNRGRYKCNFCNKPTYKTVSGVLTHVQGNHELELANATVEDMRAKLDAERSKPPKVVERERVVYKDRPEPKYHYVNVFCTTCKWAFNAGIPSGYSVENTRHSHCGVVSLFPITRSDI